jgi:hypothetical protein
MPNFFTLSSLRQAPLSALLVASAVSLAACGDEPIDLSKKNVQKVDLRISEQGETLGLVPFHSYSVAADVTYLDDKGNAKVVKDADLDQLLIEGDHVRLVGSTLETVVSNLDIWRQGYAIKVTIPDNVAFAGTQFTLPTNWSSVTMSPFYGPSSGSDGPDLDLYVARASDGTTEYRLLKFSALAGENVTDYWQVVPGSNVYTIESNGRRGADGSDGSNGSSAYCTTDGPSHSGGSGGSGGRGGDGGDGGNIRVWYTSTNINNFFLRVPGGSGGEGGRGGRGGSGCNGGSSGWRGSDGSDGSSGSQGSIFSTQVSRDVLLQQFQGVDLNGLTIVE